MNTFRTTGALAAAVASASLLAAVPASAHEEHGHCSGANVCQGDAACEKQGFKELSKEQCEKIEGAKFTASDHKGEDHKHEGHDHK
jgi:hypothetical protein